MAGFGDLVGRNAPALGENPSAYTVGDTWTETVGPFLDNDGNFVDFTGDVLTWTCQILDAVGGSAIATAAVTGRTDGTFTWQIPASATGSLIATGRTRRDAVWRCVAKHSSLGTVTIWNTVDSPFIILAH